MKPSLLEILIDPVARAPLRVEEQTLDADGCILEGLLCSGNFSLEMNKHVNFDWYHLRYAHRQTEGDIRGWSDEAGLSISHFDQQESGFTVRAVRA